MSHFFLESNNLILRNYRPEDWERVHVYGSVPEFSQFELWGPNTVEDTKKFISDVVSQAAQKDRFKFDLAICLKSNGLLIGGCGIRRESQSSCVANLGWAVSPEFQGRGFATESAQALVHFGFEQLHLKVIYATCDTRNIASWKVMEKLGMIQVGHLKGDKLQKGFLRDSFRYELTNK
jgi:[ribosomal protein S5]-alanine N-acetyltransferase